MQHHNLPPDAAAIGQCTIAKHVFLPRGMITRDEIILLYLLGRDFYSGQGAIIDGGAFCGASAYAFAAGIADNPRSFSRSKKIFSYDMFRCESYTTTYIKNNFYMFTDLEGNKKFSKDTIANGESFLDVFLFQTQRYADSITANPGSILDYPWIGAPISIFFIDVAKTIKIQNHLFSSYLPYLQLGGCLLQQDFYHPYHPYIHVGMEFLRPYFEILYSKVSVTRAYLLQKPIPAEVIRRVASYDFSTQECLDLMRQCIENTVEAYRLPLRIAELKLQAELGCTDQALAGLEAFTRDYGGAKDFRESIVPLAKDAVGALAVQYFDQRN